MRFRINKKIILTLLVITIMGFGIGSLILFFNPSLVSFNNGIAFNSAELGNRDTKEATVELGSRSQITIINSVGNLNVELIDGNQIEIVYEAYEKSVLDINETNNSLKIEGKISNKNSTTGINTKPISLNIKLPRSFSDQLEIKNGVGKTTLNIGNYDKLNVDTGVGDIIIYPESLLQGTIVATVGVGSLVINLPNDADVDLQANTGIGNISNSASFGLKESNSKFISQSFKGYIGEGTAKVTLKVGTGDITIR